MPHQESPLRIEFCTVTLFALMVNVPLNSIQLSTVPSVVMLSVPEYCVYELQPDGPVLLAFGKLLPPPPAGGLLSLPEPPDPPPGLFPPPDGGVFCGDGGGSAGLLS